MRFMNFKVGKSKEKPDKDTAEAGDGLVTQIAGMEEQVNDRTKELEKAKQQLQELSDTVKVPEAKDDTTPQPHGPLGELSVEPEDEEKEDTNGGILLGEATEELKVVKVKAEPAAPAEAAAKVDAVKLTAVAGDDDSLSKLFDQDDEETNPLAALINSLPDVTPQELLDDIKEIKEIIREWQQK